MITVVTPTYNREALLRRLYASLKEQCFEEFTWLIVDDGSTDNTSEFIRSIINSSSFTIKYYQKTNGGKHTALNYAFDKIKQGWVFFVDSDDYLRKDALENLSLSIRNVENEKVIVFQKMYPDGKYMCQEFPEGIVSLIKLIESGVSGDKSEIYHSSLFEKFRFPVFDGENFMAESPMHLALCDAEKIKCINYPLTICEYLPGGLSESSFYNRLKNIDSTLFVYDYQYLYFKRHGNFRMSARAAVNWWRFKILTNRSIKGSAVSVFYFFPALVVCFKDIVSERYRGIFNK